MTHNVATTSYDINWSDVDNGGTTGTIDTSIFTIGVNGTSASDLWTSQNYGSISISDPNTSSGKLVLKGESADIEINGESLNETLQAIKDALRIPNRIQRNDKLEAEFEELKKVREQYEQMVKEYQEKMQTWDILKTE
jgi:hypothetical protein